MILQNTKSKINIKVPINRNVTKTNDKIGSCKVQGCVFGWTTTTHNSLPIENKSLSKESNQVETAKCHNKKEQNHNMYLKKVYYGISDFVIDVFLIKIFVS